MPITGLSRATIASNILTDWKAKLVAIGSTFDPTGNGFCILIANALAADLEGLESNAIALGSEIVPSTADAANVTRHANVDGITIKPASFGVWGVTITGPANTTVSLTGRNLVAPSGQVYAPEWGSVTLLSSTTIDIPVKAQTAGTAPNFTTAATLTWTSAPTGCSPTATVNTSSTFNAPGQDADATADTVERVQSYRRARPASGSPADWIAKAEQIAKVHRAYCYPNLRPNPGAYAAATDLDQLGCVTVVVLGPPQGDSPTSSLIIGGSTGVQPTDVRGYFLGTYDADGISTGTAGAVYGGGPPLYPATMDPASFSIETPTTQTFDVELQCTLDPANTFPWSGTMTVDASSTATSLVVNGDQRAKNGLGALVELSTSDYRGAYQKVVLPPDGTYNAGTNKTTFDITHTSLGSFAGVPIAGGTPFPAPGNWDAIRTAVLAYMDNLGPGDVPTAAATAVTAYAVRRRNRWPRQANGGPCDVYQARLAAIALDVPGTLTAVVVTPGADLIANPKQVFVLGKFLMHA